MKNITLSVDEKVIAAVRRYAADHDSSLNRLVRDFLSRLAEHHDRARKARRRIRRLSNRSAARIGPKTWSRDNLYDR